ncbi:uncharacterized protein TrAtP1_007267 [Trichoderma atroviride]|uniref:uncharacterized protein n=1 Tax=Hypocrea atroviridis TaxID=63577 RepID=UPI00332EB570|nr:hypothetical protein TrAtP1_007267 [Trichoderma atroviride]
MKSSLLLAALPLALAVPRPILPPISFGVPSPPPAPTLASPNTPKHNGVPNSPPSYGAPDFPAVTATVTTTTQYIIIAQLSDTTFVSTLGNYPTALPWNHNPATTANSSSTAVLPTVILPTVVPQPGVPPPGIPSHTKCYATITEQWQLIKGPPAEYTRPVDLSLPDHYRRVKLYIGWC